MGWCSGKRSVIEKLVPSMIEIVGRVVSINAIASAYIDSTHYMVGGSKHVLVIELFDGTVLRTEHGWGFDAFDTLSRIKDLM